MKGMTKGLKGYLLPGPAIRDEALYSKVSTASNYTETAAVVSRASLQCTAINLKRKLVNSETSTLAYIGC